MLTVQYGVVGVATGLSREEHWIGENMTDWAFGHTHFNRAFREERGMAVIANQKGYRLIPVDTFYAESVYCCESRKDVLLTDS